MLLSIVIIDVLAHCALESGDGMPIYALDAEFDFLRSVNEVLEVVGEAVRGVIVNANVVTVGVEGVVLGIVKLVGACHDSHGGLWCVQCPFDDDT